MATGQAERLVLLERAEELAAVDAAITDVPGGLWRVGLVEGSAGIGKSSILSEGRARLPTSGSSSALPAAPPTPGRGSFAD